MLGLHPTQQRFIEWAIPKLDELDDEELKLIMLGNDYYIGNVDELKEIFVEGLRKNIETKLYHRGDKALLNRLRKRFEKEFTESYKGFL